MQKEDSIKHVSESGPRSPDAVITPRIQECLKGLIESIEQELEQIFAHAHDFDHLYKELISDAVLLNRSRAAKIMNTSPANLDRKVKRGEIEATYIDSHPRFQLAEIKRFINARKGRSCRR